MRNHFAEFIKTPKGKLLAALAAMMLSWVFLLWQMSGDISSWIPSKSRRVELSRNLKKFRAECSDIETRLHKSDRIRQRYQVKKTRAWGLRRDGDPELLLPQRIAAAAKKAELSLNNFGSVRNTRINNDFFYAELDISANAPLKNIMSFAAETAKIRPSVSWRRFNANVMMRRTASTKKNTNTNSKQNETVDSTMLIFSGTIRVIVFDGEEVKTK